MTKGAWRLLLAVQLLALPAGALLVWWWAQPVEPGGWSAQLASFLWPYMIVLTAAPGAVAGVVQTRLLRRRHRAGGVVLGILSGVAGLWLPLVYVSHGVSSVLPVETGDVVASAILWTLFWGGHTIALFLTLHRTRGAVDSSVPTTTGR